MSRSNPIPETSHDNEMVIKGLQFAVLARVFPVLRHDALKPIANAKMASSMIQRDHEGETALLDERTHQLIADVDAMLEDAVDSVRLLGVWMSDCGSMVATLALLRECTKLVFADLLLSGKKISVESDNLSGQVPLFGARYALLGWMLHLVESAPDGSEIRIALQKGRAQANIHAGGGSTALRGTETYSAPKFSLLDAQRLAGHYDFALTRSDDAFVMLIPECDRSDCTASKVGRAA